MMIQTAIVLAATLGTCTNLPPGDVKSPQYWGDVFLNKYAAEREAAMDLSHETAPTKLAQPRTVLLITGVTIPGEWFDPIKARLERDGFRTVLWVPPDLLAGDLFENSHRLADVVDGIRAQTGEARIDILAECTGGVIARHYINSLGGDQFINRMVTFISPQHGVAKAPLAAEIARWPALFDLSPGSEFLETVNNAPLDPDVKFTSIYTCTDEYIQPFETSIIPGAKNIGLACDGKSFIGHYQFFYDTEIYKIMHAELTAPTPNDPQPQPQPQPQDPNDPTVDPEEAGGGCSTTGGGASAFAMLALTALLARSRRLRPRAAS